MPERLGKEGKACSKVGYDKVSVSKWSSNSACGFLQLCVAFITMLIGELV
jgi:hypothetical protein